MAVCSCRKNASYRMTGDELRAYMTAEETPSDEDVVFAIHDEGENRQCLSNNSTTVGFVQGILEQAASCGVEECPSALRCACLIKMAFQADFRMLKMEREHDGHRHHTHLNKKTHKISKHTNLTCFI